MPPFIQNAVNRRRHMLLALLAVVAASAVVLAACSSSGSSSGGSGGGPYVSAASSPPAATAQAAAGAVLTLRHTSLGTIHSDGKASPCMRSKLTRAPSRRVPGRARLPGRPPVVAACLPSAVLQRILAAAAALWSASRHSGSAVEARRTSRSGAP
jgi:hypothetical protein